MYFQKTLAVIGLCALSACGGGSSGGSIEAFANRYAALASDPSYLVGATPDSTINGLNSSASYAGVINIGTDDPASPIGATSYYGNLDLTVNFSNATTADTITGSAGGFVQYFSEIASPKNGSAVPGSLTLSGNLTGDNTSSLSSGLNGVASGSIDGTAVAYTFDGRLDGVSAGGMSLFFDGANAASSGGVGLAVR